MNFLAGTKDMRRRLVWLTFWIILVWNLPIFFYSQTNAAEALNAYTLPRQVTYEFTLQNMGTQVLQTAELRTYAPVKQTANQRCDAVTASHPFELSVDDLGNQILDFKLDALPPYATRIIRITADLKLTAQANPSGPAAPGLWLRDEQYIEANHPSIRETAQVLRSFSVRQTAENIFKWVADRIQYAGYIKNDRGALYALQHRKGDCSEYMYLFVALCRANDIPARGVGGYICPENMVLKAADFHNWADFYQGGVWRIADPRNRIFVKNTGDYIAMRIISNETAGTENRFNRFAVKGEGLKVIMN